MNTSDLWLAARNRTAQMSKPGLLEQIGTWVSRSFPGQATRLELSLTSLLATDRAVVIDLNSYRPNFDVRGAYGAGIRDYILRVAYPAVYQGDAWQLTEDTTYRKYFEQIKGLGPDVTIGGYVIYLAGIDTQCNHPGSKELLNFTHEALGANYIPDYLIIDDEVNTWWEGSRKITATAQNQIKGIKQLAGDLWTTFKKAAWHYSAGWFVRQTAEYTSYYTSMFDTINAEQANGEKQLGNWWAWWPTVLPRLDTPDAIITATLIPTAKQENSFLQMGSWAKADLWQATDRLVTPWNGDANGVDASVTYISRPNFLKQINWTAPVVQPPSPPPNGGNQSDYVTQTEFQTFLAQYTHHTHGVPSTGQN